MTTITEKEMLTWAEIKERYPDQWVILGEPSWDGAKLLSGIVIANHPDKRVACIEGGERRKGFKMITLRYTGKTSPTRRIGIMRRINSLPS